MSQEPLDKWLYLFFQVHSGSLCHLQEANSRGIHERDLGGILARLEVGVHKVNTCESIDPVDRGFCPTLDPLEERLYLLFQVQRGIPCQLQVTGARRGHKMVFEKILAGRGGGVHEVDVSESIKPVCGGFGLPPEPFWERLYLLV